MRTDLNQIIIYVLSRSCQCMSKKSSPCLYIYKMDKNSRPHSINVRNCFDLATRYFVWSLAEKNQGKKTKGISIKYYFLLLFYRKLEQLIEPSAITLIVLGRCGADHTMRRKIKKKGPCLYNEKSALIKQKSLFLLSIVMIKV